MTSGRPIARAARATDHRQRRSRPILLVRTVARESRFAAAVDGGLAGANNEPSSLLLDLWTYGLAAPKLGDELNAQSFLLLVSTLVLVSALMSVSALVLVSVSALVSTLVLVSASALVSV